MTDGMGVERTVVLLRHAKAASPDDTADVDRPLTARGRADATDLGAWLAQRGLLPDLVICSTARRTRETWSAVAAGLAGSISGGTSAQSSAGWPGEPNPRVRYEARAYAADPADLTDLLRATAADVDTLLLIGHNPAISLLSVLLDPAAASRQGLPTCGVAVHRHTGPWSAVGRTTAPLITHRR